MADQAIGVRWWGASRLVVRAVLFAGFYIDDRHANVPGIDCYDPPATQDGTAFVTCDVRVLPPPSTWLHGKTVAALDI